MPGDCKKGLRDYVAKLKYKGVEAVWTPMENLHLSLVFLGEIREIGKVNECAKNAASGIDAFQVQIEGLGMFGGRRRPRVLWAGVTPSVALMHFQEKLVQVLVDAGFRLEKRAYMPHVTLGRIKPAHKVPANLPAILQDAERNISTFVFPVVGFDLMQSHLDNQGSRYEVIKHIGFSK